MMLVSQAMCRNWAEACCTSTQWQMVLHAGWWYISYCEADQYSVSWCTQRFFGCRIHSDELLLVLEEGMYLGQVVLAGIVLVIVNGRCFND
jgi:hypothetical protein